MVVEGPTRTPFTHSRLFCFKRNRGTSRNILPPINDYPTPVPMESLQNHRLAVSRLISVNLTSVKNWLTYKHSVPSILCQYRSQRALLSNHCRLSIFGLSTLLLVRQKCSLLWPTNKKWMGHCSWNYNFSYLLFDITDFSFLEAFFLFEFLNKNLKINLEPRTGSVRREVFSENGASMEVSWDHPQSKRPEQGYKRLRSSHCIRSKTIERQGSRHDKVFLTVSVISRLFHSFSETWGWA